MKSFTVLLPLLLLLAADARPACGDKSKGRPAGGVQKGNARPRPTPDAGAPPMANPAPPAMSPAAPAPAEAKPPAAGADPADANENAAKPKPSAAPAAAPPPQAMPAAGGGGVSPVGLAINGDSKANVASFGGKIGWYYSWNMNTLTGTDGLEFVPMVWGKDAANAFDGKIPGGSTHILGFNEPDIGREFGGSSMSAAEAAPLHQKWTAKVPQGVKIGAPGVARGGNKWLKDFNSACGGKCKYDFTPAHWYGTNANDMIKDIKTFHSDFNAPIWLTEWACHDYGTGKICNVDEVKAFMTTAIKWFRSDEGKQIVERWSYFGAFPNYAQTNANGLENMDGTANEVGKLYGSL